MNIRQFELCSAPIVIKPNQLHESHPETGRFITMWTTACHFYLSQTRMNPTYEYIGICRHNTKYVILAKHCIRLPDDGFMWTETWSSFHNFNYFINIKIL